ncbi:MAG TPA: SPOR domain-containing protein [Bryobacteraceae bacterium]|jgi:cell division protein FtsN|nr:SPOR domain-containing protein [Bryobacteraceae bacterium]
MLRTEDNETEILLGNKQLLGIFFVVAVLLGVAFYGGYMVGKAAPGNKIAVTGPAQDTATSQETSTSTGTATGSAKGGETHTLASDTSTPPDPTEATQPEPQSSEPPLGTPKAKKPKPATAPPAALPPPTSASTRASSSFTPLPGQQFLQVAAVGRDEALGVAEVLHAKGFSAHAVPKPGNPTIYRVIIGPLRDAGDLSTTRDALRRTGFREVIVQKY